MALASDYTVPVTTLPLLCRPDSPSRLNIMTLDPAYMGLFLRGTCRTLASHGVQSRCAWPLSSLRSRQASFDAMEGDEVARSIMALSRLRPLVGGCPAKVGGRFPCCCCCCRPVTKLTGASAASRVSGPLIRHPSARDFGVTGPGVLSRDQRPGRRHR